MRQFYKKISSVCMALLCVAALLIGCTATAWAADEIDDSVKSQLVTTTKGLTDAIIAMSEDDIQFDFGFFLGLGGWCRVVFWAAFFRGAAGSS